MRRLTECYPDKSGEALPWCCIPRGTAAKGNAELGGASLPDIKELYCLECWSGSPRRPGEPVGFDLAAPPSPIYRQAEHDHRPPNGQTASIKSQPGNA